jgi:hypothetical protein
VYTNVAPVGDCEVVDQLSSRVIALMLSETTVSLGNGVSTVRLTLRPLSRRNTAAIPTMTSAITTTESEFTPIPPGLRKAVRRYCSSP